MFFVWLCRHPKPDEAAVLEGNMPPEFTLPLIDQMKQAGEDVEFSVTGNQLYYHIFKYHTLHVHIVYIM